MSHVRVRFAPSPTGTLHVGGARTALFNWLYARNQQGIFILRIEDTDQERSTVESHAQILRSLRWLGLDWDEGPEMGGAFGPYVQSERRAIYAQYAQRLLDEGLGYHCYCAPDELAQRRAEAMAQGRPPGYDRRCRTLTDEQRRRFEAEGRAPVLRARMPDEGVTKWTDLVHGETEFQNTVLDDWVALKSDGFPTYNFGAVVDDGLMEISHVLRGDDHISNTPRQIVLFKAFGFRAPKFGHLPMILGPDRQRLSKRHGAASAEEFRDAGFLPQALVNYLALLGWSPGDNREVFTTEQLIKAFSLKRLNNTAAVFDLEKAKHINAEHMKLLPTSAKVELAWPILLARGLAHEGDEAARIRLGRVIEIMGNRFSNLGDIPTHLACYFTEDYSVDPQGASVLDEAARERVHMLAAAYQKLPVFTAKIAEGVLRELATNLQVDAGDLIHPARYALSGRTVGPSLFAAMEVLGQKTVVARLRRPKVS